MDLGREIRRVITHFQGRYECSKGTPSPSIDGCCLQFKQGPATVSHKTMVTPQDTPVPTLASALAVHQVVALKHGDCRLYGEVIQVVVDRQRCWVRPLAYVESCPTGEHASLSTPFFHTCYSLQHGPDIIWPLHLFEAALDTDWLSVLTQLQQHGQRCDRATANRLLRTLLEAVCPTQTSNDAKGAIVPYCPPLPLARNNP